MNRRTLFGALAGLVGWTTGAEAITQPAINGLRRKVVGTRDVVWHDFVIQPAADPTMALEISCDRYESGCRDWFFLNNPEEYRIIKHVRRQVSVVETATETSRTVLVSGDISGLKRVARDTKYDGPPLVYKPPTYIDGKIQNSLEWIQL